MRKGEIELLLETEPNRCSGQLLQSRKRDRERKRGKRFDYEKYKGKQMVRWKRVMRWR